MAWLVVSSLPAPAATIVVDEATCRLVDAITAANTDAAVGGCAAGSGPDTIELTTDGEPATLTIQGWEIHRRMYWEGETLVLESKSSREDRVTNVVVRYRLAEDGRTFFAEESLQRAEENHDNLWVFERSAEP